jgi:tight adherence protein B
MSAAIGAAMLVVLAAGFAAGALSREHRDRLVAALVPGVGKSPEPPDPSGVLRDGWANPESIRVGWALGGLGVGLVVAGIPGALCGLAIGLVGSIVVRRRRLTRHSDRVAEQLPDAVGAIAAALRSGLSITQAVAFAGDEVGPPLGPSLRAVGDRSALGVPLEMSLSSWAGSMATSDARLLVDVLQLHHRAGGDLPAVLDQVRRALRDRRVARREVRSLTAQARMSGAILGSLPVGFFVFLWITSRTEMASALGSRLGMISVGVGVVLEAAAFVWIRRLLRVEP